MRVIVIGASAGGVEALQRLVRRLPHDLPHAVYVVLHGPPSGSNLPSILARHGSLPASFAEEGEPMRPGHIAVAPPNQHLLIDRGRIRVVLGPKEHGHRPAIDPLFRSAAQAYGDRVVGMVLSGTRDDGSAGLGWIKQRGGTTVVQDPEDAIYPAMPQNAIAAVGEPDFLGTAEEVAGFVAALSPHGGPEAESRQERDMADPTERGIEETTAANRAHGELTAFRCPECGGSLWEIQDGDVTKLRCRVGHAYSEESMLADQGEQLEAALWSACVALEERAEFLERLRDRFQRGGQQHSAARYGEGGSNAREQAAVVRRALLSLERWRDTEEQAS